MLSTPIPKVTRVIINDERVYPTRVYPTRIYACPTRIYTRHAHATHAHVTRAGVVCAECIYAVACAAHRCSPCPHVAHTSMPTHSTLAMCTVRRQQRFHWRCCARSLRLLQLRGLQDVRGKAALSTLTLERSLRGI